MVSKLTETKEEAIKLKEKFDSESREMFCPAINGLCVIECVCFKRSFYQKLLENDESIEYLVFRGYCNNPAFFRE